MPTIGLTGDVMLGRKVDEYQQRRPVDAVWGDLLERLQEQDGLFVNLECCLSTRGERWTRTYRPFHFRADPDWAVPALERATVDFASLANNHLMDFGAPALVDTLDELDAAGIAHAGAGRDRPAAREPAVVEIDFDTDAEADADADTDSDADADVDSLTVALVAFTDNTPEYAATEDGPGVAYLSMDPDDPEDRSIVTTALDRVRSSDPDLLVASVHWGPNMEAIPDDRHRRFGRLLVEAGVDLVHGHSAHVFQGVERHDGGLICYDTGDFVDDYAVDEDLRNDRSFLFELTVSAGGELRELRLRPTEIYDCSVHRADREIAAWSRKTMRERSEPFGTGDAFDTDGEDLVLVL